MANFLNVKYSSIDRNDEEDYKPKKIRHPLDALEPILINNENRLVVYPILHNDIWNMYKRHQRAFWTAEEISLDKDVDDWKFKMRDNERKFITAILAFFASADGVVNDNLLENFSNEVQYVALFLRVSNNDGKYSCRVLQHDYKRLYRRREGKKYGIAFCYHDGMRKNENRLDE